MSALYRITDAKGALLIECVAESADAALKIMNGLPVGPYAEMRAATKAGTPIPAGVTLDAYAITPELLAAAKGDTGKIFAMADAVRKAPAPDPSKDPVSKEPVAVFPVEPDGKVDPKKPQPPTKKAAEDANVVAVKR